MGYLPVSVAPAKGKGLKTEIIIPGLSDRIKQKEVAVFTRQFATMVDSGLTISRSIAVLANQVENKHFAIVLRKIHDDVDTGTSLSVALAKHPKVFDDLYVAMVAAGEIGGSIDLVLKNIAVTLEKQVELNRKVRGAMTYPIIVMCVIGVIVTVMIVVIVPIFKKLFASLGGKLPLPTQILINISNTLASWHVGLVILFVGIGRLPVRALDQDREGQRTWDRFKMRPPVFGPVTHKAGTQPLRLHALVPSRGGRAGDGGPRYHGQRVGQLDHRRRRLGGEGPGPRGHVLRGAHEPSGASSRRSSCRWSRSASRPVPWTTCSSASSDFYIDEVDQTVDNLTSILEPFLVVIMGVVIGAIIISLYLPMFDYIKLIH